MRFFSSWRAKTPELSGDTYLALALRGEDDEQDELVARIDEDFRHRVGVPRWMTCVAFLLLLVHAIAMIPIPVESTTLDLSAYKDGEWLVHLPRLLTAFALSLLVVGAIAVWSHLVGVMTWAAINTPAGLSDGGVQTSAEQDQDAEDESSPTDTTSRFFLPRLWSVVSNRPILIMGWAGVVVMSVLTAVTIFARLGHAVTQETGVGTAAGVCIAVLVGAMAAAAPVCVAVVTARKPSPELLRGNAWAQPITETDRRVDSACFDK